MKKRKTAGNLSKNFRKKQAFMLYKPIIRSRSNRLSFLELEKLHNSFFDSWEDFSWERTSNLKIDSTKSIGKHYLRCNVRLRHNDLKGKRK